MLDEIIKTALLGTDRYIPEGGLGFTDIMQNVASRQSDKEACFLTQSGIYFLLKDAAPALCEVVPDEYPVPVGENRIHERTAKVVQRALADDNVTLLHYAIHRLTHERQIISPVLVPDFLEKYSTESVWRTRLIPLCGQTGQNMIRLKSLTGESVQTVQTDMATADATGIREWIIGIRNEQPSALWEPDEGKTVSTFEEIISREKADKRAEWMELLETGLGEADIPFLAQQLKAKSKTVKAVALRLLMQVEGSEVQADFCTLLRELITLEERALFMGLKKTTSFVPATTHVLSETQKAYGLEEMSSEKLITDVMHHLYQCVALMPLSLIATCFNISEQEVIDKLYTEWNHAYIRKAFIQQAYTYKHPLLLKALVEKENDSGLPDLLPFDDACALYLRWIKNANSANQRIAYATALFGRLFRETDYPELPIEVVKVILQLLHFNSYCLQGKQYYRLGLNLPAAVRSLLQQEINKPPARNENGYRQQHLQHTLQALDDKEAFTGSNPL